ncbi:MAG: UvrB/UvrC motif-containing protein [Candidatus Omnitrophica bacterium]|nr:UvrB/UvrC motif-containing protein [Candidatus Omnitrophota bacterium]
MAPLIQRKREELRLAVSSEDFESAARLRDEIRQLEGQILS